MENETVKQFGINGEPAISDSPDYDAGGCFIGAKRLSKSPYETTKLIIEHKCESHDCECCGSFETDDVTVRYGDKTLDLRFSGHFGDGNYNPFDKFDMVRKIVEFLGYTVEGTHERI